MSRKSAFKVSMLSILISSTTLLPSLSFAVQDGLNSKQYSANIIQYPDELVIKFKQDITLPDGSKVDHGGNGSVAAIEKLPLGVASLKFQKLFEVHSGVRTPLRGRPEKAKIFDRYYTALFPKGVDPKILIERLKKSPFVETAYLKPKPVAAPSLPPNSTPVYADDDVYFPNQGYAMESPEGVNSSYAWLFEGGDGKGIKWVDVEQGWALNHEDLVAHNIQLLPGGLNAAFHGHGTAVLGEISAVDNGIGNIGLASKAQPFVSSQHRSSGGYNTAEAILSALTVLSPGDVILLEAQAGYPTASGYVPVEVYPAELDAIQYVTSLGITVVEAAGNGSVDLDTFQTTDGKYVLNPDSPDFIDSGAIIVGAATSYVPHDRLGFSNYGNRVDTFGWGGWDVSTLDATDENSTTGYQSWFSGTSSASPIVAGAAISIQGVAKAHFGATYSPSEIRYLLKEAAYNTPSFDRSADKIGVLPDVKAILDDHFVAPGTVVIDQLAPSAPSNLYLENLQSSYAILHWASATDNNVVISYEVFVNGSSTPILTSSNILVLSFLVPSTSYSIVIRARDGSNNLSPLSVPLVFNTPPVSYCSIAPWSRFTPYYTGSQVIYNGLRYKARWFTYDQRPDLNSGQWGVWEFLGQC